MVTAKRLGVVAVNNTAEEVKESLRSVPACPHDLHETLYTLLDIPQRQLSLTIHPKRKASRSTVDIETTGRSQKKRPSTKDSELTKTRTKNISNKLISPLQGISRPKYATEIFNITIKSLSEAVKALLTIEDARKELITKRSHPSQSDQKNLKSGKVKTTSVEKQGRDGELHTVVVVRCAQAALECLRQDTEKFQPDEDTILKREQGAIVFLDRLISLGLYDIALEESAKIYEQYWKRRKRALQHATKEINLAEMISIPVDPSDAPSHNFAASFQSQILRLAICSSEQTLSLAFANAIMVTIPGSPCSNILEALAKGYISNTTAGHQMRTLSNALLKMLHVQHSDLKDRTKRHAVLKITLEAARSKIESWKLLEHTPALDTEFWSFVSKTLGSVFHPTTTSSAADYLLLKDLIKGLQDELQRSDLSNQLPQSLQDFVINSAELNGFVKDAKLLLQQIECTSQESQDLRSMRVAALMLRSQSPEVGEISQLDVALSSIRNLRCSEVVNFNAVFTELTRLRKACSCYISTAEQEMRAEEHNDMTTDRQKLCIEILFSMLETGLSFENDTTRISLSKFFEAALEAEKCSIARQGCLTVECNDMLETCVKSIQHILSSAQDEEDVSLEVFRRLCVRISNILYLRYTQRTQLSHAVHPSTKLLQLSIEVMHNRCLADQKQAAFGVKLEKLAQELQDLKDPESAMRSYRVAIEHYIQAGALVDATEVSFHSKYNLAWTDKETLSFQLSRVLRARLILFSECPMLYDKDTLLYDRQGLPPTQRFTLLEQQIRLVISLPLCGRICPEIIQLSCTVLSLLPNEEFKFCRARFVLYLLRALSTRPDIVMNDLMEELNTANLFESSNRSHALHLEKFGPAITRTLALQCEMLKSTQDIAIIRERCSDLCETLRAILNKADVHSHIDDVNTVLQLLQTASDYFRYCADTEFEMVSLQVKIRLVRQVDANLEESLTSTLIRITECQLNLQDYDAARTSIDEISSVSSSTVKLSDIRTTLLSAEYQYNVQNFEKCQTALELARTQYATLLGLPAGLSTSDKIEADSLVCRASLIESQLSFHKGDVSAAAVFARKAVKISTSIWANIGSAKTQISPLPPTKNPVFWKYFDLHFNALSNMATIAAHLGSYTDASWYCQSARQIAQASHSNAHLALMNSTLAVLYAKAGRKEETLDLIETESQKHYNLKSCMGSKTLLSQAEAFLELADYDSARQQIINFDHNCLNLITPGPAALIPTVTVQKNQKKPGMPVKGSKKINGTKISSSDKPKPTLEMEAAVLSSLTARELKDRYDALKTLLNTEQLDAVSACSVSPITPNQPIFVHYAYSQVCSLLSAIMENLSTKSNTAVLSETAIALPVRYKNNGRGGRVSLMQAHPDPTMNVSKKKKQIAITTSRSKQEEAFLVVHNLIRDLVVCRANLCAPDMVHVLHKLLSQTVLFSSTMNMPFVYTSSQLVLQALSSKDVVLSRERATILAEQATKDAKVVRQWPSQQRLPASASSMQTTHSEHDLDKLPGDWSVFSISLSEDQKELLISKTVGGRTPFLLRIPLTRSDNVDQHDEFNFIDARDMIKSVIDEANQLAHDLRGSGDKESRTAWHAERLSVEEQLQAWLANVENLWLGGFRGLFAPYHFPDAIVKNFRHAISNVMDKHLPSRQRPNPGTLEKIELHTHVLEMFLGLGEPDENDLDDAIEDLLYFVVDIVQFGGERNAYDEIDWDSMLVDVLSALTESYHSTEVSRTQHTILILDKELEVFPWESLPCLRQQPVSRMPSMGSIFERLTLVQKESSTPSSYRIPEQHQGAYILNPSKDLVSTQELFQPLLRTSAPDYTSLIGKAPSEEEFMTMLNSNDIMLYFGHGSAAQYIRGRSIRALEECAVTLLMGCSSAKMTECGKFESHGMPGYYMLGGSMSVVGNLWDVTDRDIDRFALTTMIEWGLLERDDEHVQEALQKSSKRKKNAKGKREEISAMKHNVKGKGEKTSRVSLAEAVMKGRDACVLPYLNGGAPVVYGIPVLLE